mmetsp:Transcript_92405/g.263995  ORF Transcript_92405/g.263995 Transcript_92405/m.263995 type:complete len:355 (+) Transcript_92405:263-1327(+)
MARGTQRLLVLLGHHPARRRCSGRTHQSSHDDERELGCVEPRSLLVVPSLISLIIHSSSIVRRVGGVNGGHRAPCDVVLQRVSLGLVLVPGVPVRAVEGQVPAGGDIDKAAPTVVPPPSVERVIVHILAPWISVVRVARAGYHGAPIVRVEAAIPYRGVDAFARECQVLVRGRPLRQPPPVIGRVRCVLVVVAAIVGGAAIVVEVVLPCPRVHALARAHGPLSAARRVASLDKRVVVELVEAVDHDPCVVINATEGLIDKFATTTAAWLDLALVHDILREIGEQGRADVLPQVLCRAFASECDRRGELHEIVRHIVIHLGVEAGAVVVEVGARVLVLPRRGLARLVVPVVRQLD